MEEISRNILEYLKKHKNFDYTAYHSEMLERRIQNRIMHTFTNSPQEYYQYLQNQPKEAALLIDNFMINVSHFFRDSLCFEFLAHQVLPQLIEKKQSTGDKNLRIWSAGCSHGEEPYSMAIVLNEILKSAKYNFNINFFATDFDAEAIKQARQGIYTIESLKEIKVAYFQKYFKHNDEKYEIAPEIKEMIQFSEYDLLDEKSYAPSESVFGDFDLVLCRNVLIYFNQDYQDKIFAKLNKALTKGGILILGEAEVPINKYKERFRKISRYCKIYETI